MMLPPPWWGSAFRDEKGVYALFKPGRHRPAAAAPRVVRPVPLVGRDASVTWHNTDDDVILVGHGRCRLCRFRAVCLSSLPVPLLSNRRTKQPACKRSLTPCIVLLAIDTFGVRYIEWASTARSSAKRRFARAAQKSARTKKAREKPAADEDVGRQRRRRTTQRTTTQRTTSDYVSAATSPDRATTARRPCPT